MEQIKNYQQKHKSSKGSKLSATICLEWTEKCHRFQLAQSTQLPTIEKLKYLFKRQISPKKQNRFNNLKLC